MRKVDPAVVEVAREIERGELEPARYCSTILVERAPRSR
jgi:hypothetical protein